MKTRLIASIALGAAVVLGTSGCAMLAPQSTTIQYSASDGINVPAGSGPVAVRNALIVANEDGTEGNLVAAIVNPGDSPEVLNIQVGEGSSAIPLTVRMPAATTKSLGDGETDPLLIEDLDAVPGSTVSLYFQSGDSEGVRIDVPVLDGSLDYLAPLAP
ncbi:DNA modification methylase [Microbacterium sp. cx-55]|uniref:DNA modification methylase n=1 Tax=unclassified Microbacterium TaxID=2609290 RepID=UPI001CBE6AB8|nr:MULTISPECIES: DNA modification methylase [unclassified Microbacterium]MBZ4488141.1 DNA modification methylase [Microbacterium sp. cx-55]MCC4908855.1 DNA modification methylase [Microbacterium sp. cx-59]UGB34449.1 DNA modification methylase [Microbacterium sp. cx-55]